MKRIYILTALSLFFASITSCQKWLEVDPEDRFTEEQIFSSQEGFYEALNGLYLGLAKDNLYGDKMTLTTVELLANRYYNSSSQSSYKYLSVWDYTNGTSQSTFSSIWQEAYLSIANANNLISNVNKYGSNISSNDAQLIKGQALAVRALVHLDLLRLFGPIYNSKDSLDTAIPYYTELSPDIQSFLPANEVMLHIMKDINDAAKLLEIDNSGITGSTNYNNYRFNHVALLALKARALQWSNQKEAAYVTAKQAIELSNNFTWVTRNEATNTTNPDRVFVNEMLFGIFSNTLYTNYDKYFSFDLDAQAILYSPNSTFIKELIYENRSNDYRNDPQWKSPAYGVIYPTFTKFADITDKNSGYKQRFTIPLIRKSEIYYIAAECAPTSEEGLTYLNEVRVNRGINPLETATQISNELMKEYRKEFYGEGQLWYYYKRNKISGILSAMTGLITSVPASAWVVPIPLTETDNR